MGYNTKTGILVSLTNVRNRSVITPKNALSRGELVLNLLEHAIPTSSNTIPNINLPHSHSLSPHITFDHIRTIGMTSTSNSLDLGQEYGPCNVIIASLMGQDGKYSDTYVPEAYFLSNCVIPTPTPSPYATPNISGPLNNESSPVFPTTTSTTATIPSNLTISTTDSIPSMTVPKHPSFASRYATVKRIDPGIHVLSNSVLDDENWDKVRYLKQQLTKFTTNEYSFPTLQELIQRYQPKSTLPPSMDKDYSVSIANSAEFINEAEISLVEIVLKQLVPLMITPTPVPIEEQISSKGDLSWSPLHSELESKLQQHIFVPHNQVYNYGTRALSIVIQVGKSIYYCYSSFDPEDPLTIDRTQSNITSEHLVNSLARQINAITHPSILAKGETSGQLHTSITEADSVGVHSTVPYAYTTGIGVSNELVEIPKTDTASTVLNHSGTTLPELPRVASQKHTLIDVAGIQWIIIRSLLPHTINSSSSTNIESKSNV